MWFRSMAQHQRNGLKMHAFSRTFGKATAFDLQTQIASWKPDPSPSNDNNLTLMKWE